jgi:maltose alpha-D-glucosyltransferase/alpha-amylase
VQREVSPLDWYKDAVLYEVAVRSFSDSNDDGVGDLAGLVAKLDYIQSLGVTGLLLLPFYPSPRYDDGYDIVDFENVHPVCGTLADFDRLVSEAHARRLRVVIDLVVNHTSDMHSWFQAARRAPNGSPQRNFYVWSDTDQKYQGARVLFSDYETSNWTWDDTAGAYYFHRFFHHQPDLNFDNPDVFYAVVSAIRFWLDRGVDGLRLSAAAYLVEREATSCEHLPETHRVLARLKEAIAVTYPDRPLIVDADRARRDAGHDSEARDYCHVAWDTALSSRIFMALRLEDRQPLVEHLTWMSSAAADGHLAFALRNHDELSLESLTDLEREYMYDEYARDERMRVNGGLRRRLAPLVENSRPRIELLYSLLLSIPGTPVIYYGDEIGMGDNIYLGDRGGLRTPMQWSGDRNGGFSRADPSRLYSPPILDPVYGYESVNVEAQHRSPSSLLSWVRRMIDLHRRHPVLARGRLTIVPSTNPKVIAYLRSDDETRLLCIANLSRHATVAQLDLREFAGQYVPMELLGLSEFPPIGDDFYAITLGAYGFQWFSLEALPEDDPRRVQFYSCFISYSTHDQAFAERLHRDLNERGVRCWFALHDVRGGEKLYSQIESAIRSHDRVLLILSRDSMASEWVKTEIARARQREMNEKREVLFPITLVGYDFIKAWECFDADTGKDSAREIREYFIPDFSQWRDERQYGDALQKLLKSLRSGKTRKSR